MTKMTSTLLTAAAAASVALCSATPANAEPRPVKVRAHTTCSYTTVRAKATDDSARRGGLLRGDKGVVSGGKIEKIRGVKKMWLRGEWKRADRTIRGWIDLDCATLGFTDTDLAPFMPKQA